MKTTCLIIASLLTFAGACPAQTTSPKDFMKALSEASGGPGGINLDEPKDQLETRLVKLQELLPSAPDDASRDAVNSNICILLALTGKTDEAMKTAALIKDPLAREKKMLHIVQISQGADAVVARLAADLSDPQFSEDKHLVLVEKVISTLKGSDKTNPRLIEMTIAVLGKTQFTDNNALLGVYTIKMLRGAQAAKAPLDGAKLRPILERITTQTPKSGKTEQLLEQAQKLNSSLPPQ